jgi:hypothetical protein
MTQKYWLTAGALALASFAAAAQPPAARPDPLDASAAVPPVIYQSAFEGYQPASGTEPPSADKLWRQANADVGNPDPHSGHAAAPAPVPAPAAAAAAEAKPAAVDHSKHH